MPIIYTCVQRTTIKIENYYVRYFVRPTNQRDIKIRSKTMVIQAINMEFAIDCPGQIFALYSIDEIWHHHMNESVYDIDIQNMGLLLVFEYGAF